MRWETPWISTPRIYKVALLQKGEVAYESVHIKQVNNWRRTTYHCQVGQGSYQAMIALCQPIKDDPCLEYCQLMSLPINSMMTPLTWPIIRRHAWMRWQKGPMAKDLYDYCMRSFWGVCWYIWWWYESSLYFYQCLFQELSLNQIKPIKMCLSLGQLHPTNLKNGQPMIKSSLWILLFIFLWMLLKLYFTLSVIDIFGINFFNPVK